MAKEATVLEFRVREEYARILLKEAKQLPSALPKKGDSVQSLRSLALESTTLVDVMWRKFLLLLEQEPMPVRVVQTCASGARHIVDSTRELLSLLQDPGTNGGNTELPRVSDVLDRIDRELKAVEEVATRRPRLDLEEVRRGIEEAKRGEGEDLGMLLASLPSRDEG